MKVRSLRSCSADANPAAHWADVVRCSHQANANGAKAVAAQQVQSQSAQQDQDLNAIAVAVTFGDCSRSWMSRGQGHWFSQLPGFCKAVNPALVHKPQWALGLVRRAVM